MKSTVDPSGSLRPKRVNIRKHPVCATAESIREEYETMFGEPPAEPGGWYRPDDWRRVSYVLGMLQPGGDLLDVGVGAGQFLNMLARSGSFRSVVGIDKARFKKYTEFEPGMQKSDGDIAALDFPDDSFDVVTCMEVLEHVPSEVFTAGLRELRRVCRGQLIMSVPFQEPEPISKTHVRRFEGPDILEFFPSATYTLLDRPRMPWILMEESFGSTSGSSTEMATDARDVTIEHLRAEVASLQARKSIRIANRIGRTARVPLQWLRR